MYMSELTLITYHFLVGISMCSNGTCMVECPAGYNRCHIIISGSSHLDGLHCIGFVCVSGVWCACVLHVSIVYVCVYWLRACVCMVCMCLVCVCVCVCVCTACVYSVRVCIHWLRACVCMVFTCIYAYKLYTNSGFFHQKEDYISSCW